MLGMRRTSLSTLLNHGELYVWWRKYKDKRIVENARARRQRAYYHRKVRMLLEAGYDMATASALAGQPKPRNSWPELAELTDEP